MPPNACAPSGPRTEHNVPPERTESATASERYAARHPTETAISGQAPSVARREPASTRRVQRPREPARYAPSEGGQEDAPPRSERRPAQETGGGMQPDGRATHRRPCRFHEPALTAAGCPGRKSGTERRKTFHPPGTRRAATVSNSLCGTEKDASRYRQPESGRIRQPPPLAQPRRRWPT